MIAQLRRHALWALIGPLVVLAACMASPAASSPSGAETPAASTPVGAVDCAAIDLRTPSGQRIDLTGAWSGGSTVHFLRQSGSCVWWEAVSNLPGDLLGTYWRNVFQGQLSSDFTLAGDWAEIFNDSRFRQGGPENGWVEFAIQVAETSGQEEITLNQLAVRGDPYRIQALHRIAEPVWPNAPDTP